MGSAKAVIVFFERRWNKTPRRKDLKRPYSFVIEMVLFLVPIFDYDEDRSYMEME